MKHVHKDHLDSDWTTVSFKIGDNKIQGGLLGAIDDTNQFIIAGNFSSPNWIELISSNPILIGKHHMYLFTFYKKCNFSLDIVRKQFFECVFNVYYFLEFPRFLKM